MELAVKKELMKSGYLIFDEDLSLELCLPKFHTHTHTMADHKNTVNPPLIGEEVIPESLRLHSTIPTQTAAKMAKYQKFQPKNAVSRTGAISFDILTGDQKYMNISSAVLHIKCKIRNGKSERIPLKGDPPTGGGAEPFHPMGKVLPVNGMGYTLFTNVKVALNNVPID